MYDMAHEPASAGIMSDREASERFSILLPAKAKFHDILPEVRRATLTRAASTLCEFCGADAAGDHGVVTYENTRKNA
jgi:hypothetical protein